MRPGKLAFWLLLVAALPLSVARAQSTDPSAILARARAALRFDRIPSGSLLHFHSSSASEQNYQSDRTYPPFFSAMDTEETWFDPRSGSERSARQTLFPGNAAIPPQTSLSTATRAYGLFGGRILPLPETSLQTRYLNPWTVVADWSASPNVRYSGTESFRDYPRIVLTRSTPSGEQRLLLDPKTGFPLSLQFTEKHYLWGQRKVEYLFTNWTLAGTVMVAGSSFRLADGKIEISRTTGDAESVTDTTPPEWKSLPSSDSAPEPLPRFLRPIDPVTTQIGPNTWLLTNPGYTEAVTKIGDEVFLFDATQGEERAAKDAAILAKLFPGYKKLTLVVTDLAWPHIAGVRYWVANGATVMSHRAAREFLQSVVDRKWTLAPDLLEQRRSSAKFQFVPIDSVTKLAGGAISLHPIDGIGSEVALMAYLSNDKFLWASDFIQTLDGPASYTTEVFQAVQRDHLQPERVAAEHLPLTPWPKIESLAKQDLASH